MNRTIAVVVMACGMACSQTATESVHRLNNSVDSLLQTVSISKEISRNKDKMLDEYVNTLHDLIALHDPKVIEVIESHMAALKALEEKHNRLVHNMQAEGR